MGDVISFRAARKQKARGEKEEAAAANRAKFGRSKAEKLLTKAEAERANAALDGHHRDDEKP